MHLHYAALHQLRWGKSGWLGVVTWWVVWKVTLFVPDEVILSPVTDCIKCDRACILYKKWTDLYIWGGILDGHQLGQILNKIRCLVLSHCHSDKWFQEIKCQAWKRVFCPVQLQLHVLVFLVRSQSMSQTQWESMIHRRWRGCVLFPGVTTFGFLVVFQGNQYLRW